MGVKGLHPHLRPAIRACHVEELHGQRAGIDAMVWYASRRRARHPTVNSLYADTSLTTRAIARPATHAGYTLESVAPPLLWRKGRKQARKCMHARSVSNG